MSVAQTPSSSGRKRRSKYRKELLSQLTMGENISTAVRWGMALLTLAYLAVSLYTFRQDVTLYASMWPQATKAEVLYGFGRPNVVVGSAGEKTAVTSATSINDFPDWRYVLPSGGTVSIRYDGTDGLVQEISCTDPTAGTGSCPATLGLEIGTSEEQLQLTLGRPNRQAYDGLVKVLYYDSIGMEFVLRRYMINRISLHRHDGWFSLVRYLQYAIPG